MLFLFIIVDELPEDEEDESDDDDGDDDGDDDENEDSDLTNGSEDEPSVINGTYNYSQ